MRVRAERAIAAFVEAVALAGGEVRRRGEFRKFVGIVGIEVDVVPVASGLSAPSAAQHIVEFDEAAALTHAPEGRLIGRDRLCDQHGIGRVRSRGLRDLARLPVHGRDDPRGVRLGDRRDQVLGQIEEFHPAHVAVRVAQERHLRGIHAVFCLDFDEDGRALDPHGRGGSGDVHAASLRDLSGDEDETALDQVEAAEVVLPRGVVDQRIDHHPARRREREDRAVDEGHRQPCVGPGLKNVVGEYPGSRTQRLDRAVGPLHRRVPGNAFHLSDRVAHGPRTNLRELPGRFGSGQPRDASAAQDRAVGRKQVSRRAHAEVVEDSDVGRALVAQDEVAPVAQELGAEQKRRGGNGHGRTRLRIDHDRCGRPAGRDRIPKCHALCPPEHAHE